MNRTLYAISDDLLALEDLLTELGGEVTNEEAEAAIDEWLSALGAERDQKLDSYAALIREFEVRAEARKSEAARLLERSRADAANADRMKNRLKRLFEDRGWKKLETTRFGFSLVKNGGKVPVLVEAAPEDLPNEYRRTKVVMSADLDAIRAVLEAGNQLEFARLGERGQGLRIK